GRDVGDEDRGEDVHRRDQQRGAHALEDGVPEDQDAETGCGRADERADCVHDQTRDETALTAPAIGELAARDPERGHHPQEERDRDLPTLDRRVEVLADVVDHHVHVRAREAANELRERERNQDLAYAGPSDVLNVSHARRSYAVDMARSETVNTAPGRSCTRALGRRSRPAPVALGTQLSPAVGPRTGSASECD